MAGGGPISSGSNSNYDPNKSYAAPMAIMTFLFFMIGFITVLNDVLIPSLKGVFDLQGWQAMLIQFCFFTAYFVISPIGGKVIDKIGYKKGLMVGLGITAVGLFLFLPAASIVSYPFFLFALFIVGSGFAFLQVAINPYIPLLGAPETASSRLNLGGAFNSFATFIGPILGGWLILSIDFSDLKEVYGCTPEFFEQLKFAKSDAVILPYIILGLITVSVAGILWFIKLPKIEAEAVAETGETKNSDFKHLLYGAGAIFFYVGTEVAIGSTLVLYLQQPEMGALMEEDGASLLAYYWGGAMVGRFIGFIILQKIRAEIGLRTVAVLAFSLVVLSMFSFAIENTMGISVLHMGNDPETGVFHIGFKSIVVPIGAVLLVLVGLCNSIMWPTIFPLGVRGLGSHTSKGSGLMVSMVLGGAIVPVIQGLIASGIKINQKVQESIEVINGKCEIVKVESFDYLLGFEGVGYRFSYLICLICYAYIFMFAFKWYKAGKVSELYKNDIKN